VGAIGGQDVVLGEDERPPDVAIDVPVASVQEDSHRRRQEDREEELSVRAALRPWPQRDRRTFANAKARKNTSQVFILSSS